MDKCNVEPSKRENKSRPYPYTRICLDLFEDIQIFVTFLQAIHSQIQRKITEGYDKHDDDSIILQFSRNWSRDKDQIKVALDVIECISTVSDSLCTIPQHGEDFETRECKFKPQDVEDLRKKLWDYIRSLKVPAHHKKHETEMLGQGYFYDNWVHLLFKVITHLTSRNYSLQIKFDDKVLAFLARWNTGIDCFVLFATWRTAKLSNLFAGTIPRHCYYQCGTSPEQDSAYVDESQHHLQRNQPNQYDEDLKSTRQMGETENAPHEELDLKDMLGTAGTHLTIQEPKPDLMNSRCNAEEIRPNQDAFNTTIEPESSDNRQKSKPIIYEDDNDTKPTTEGDGINKKITEFDANTTRSTADPINKLLNFDRDNPDTQASKSSNYMQNTTTDCNESKPSRKEYLVDRDHSNEGSSVSKESYKKIMGDSAVKQIIENDDTLTKVPKKECQRQQPSITMPENSSIGAISNPSQSEVKTCSADKMKGDNDVDVAASETKTRVTCAILNENSRSELSNSSVTVDQAIITNLHESCTIVVGPEQNRDQNEQHNNDNIKHTGFPHTSSPDAKQYCFSNDQCASNTDSRVQLDKTRETQKDQTINLVYNRKSAFSNSTELESESRVNVAERQGTDTDPHRQNEARKRGMPQLTTEQTTFESNIEDIKGQQDGSQVTEKQRKECPCSGNNQKTLMNEIESLKKELKLKNNYLKKKEAELKEIAEWQQHYSLDHPKGGSGGISEKSKQGQDMHLQWDEKQYQQKLQDAEDSNTCLTMAMNSKDEEIREKTEENSKLNEDLVSKTTELNTLKAEYSLSEKNIMMLKTELENSEANVAAFTKEVDNKNKAIASMRTDIEQVKLLRQENKELRDVHTQLETALQKAKSNVHVSEKNKQESVAAEKRKSEEYAKSNKLYQTELSKIKLENKRLMAAVQRLNADEQVLKKEIKDLQESKNSLLDRLSSKMNQEMARDESDLENISAKNRPMKLMEDYHLFCSQEWLEAKQELDDWVNEHCGDTCDEKDICTFVGDAMLRCLVVAGKLYTSTTEVVSEMLHDPQQPYVLEKMRHEGLLGSDFDKDLIGDFNDSAEITRKLDIDFQVQIAKIYKESKERDFKSLAKVTLRRHLYSKFASIEGIESLRENKALFEYYERCLSLCWKMVLQQPPMTFKCDPAVGGKYNESKHELHFGSADPNHPHAEIHYFVHPALYHGTKQMRKARVVLHINDPNEPRAPKNIGPTNKEDTTSETDPSKDNVKRHEAIDHGKPDTEQIGATKKEDDSSKAHQNKDNVGSGSEKPPQEPDDTGNTENKDSSREIDKTKSNVCVASGSDKPLMYKDISCTKNEDDFERVSSQAPNSDERQPNASDSNPPNSETVPNDAARLESVSSKSSHIAGQETENLTDRQEHSFGDNKPDEITSGFSEDHYSGQQSSNAKEPVNTKNNSTPPGPPKVYYV